MGMFDYVEYEWVCPVCKTKNNECQTKSGPKLLRRLSPDKVAHFYDFCNNCFDKGKRVHLDITIENAELSGDKND